MKSKKQKIAIIIGLSIFSLNVIAQETSLEKILKDKSDDGFDKKCASEINLVRNPKKINESRPIIAQVCSCVKNQLEDYEKNKKWEKLLANVIYKYKPSKDPKNKGFLYEINQIEVGNGIITHCFEVVQNRILIKKAYKKN